MGRSGGRRLGDNAVRVRAAGALAEYLHRMLNIVHLSRTSFTSSPPRPPKVSSPPDRILVGAARQPSAVWASGRDGSCGTCSEGPGIEDTLTPSRAEPPATAGPIGPPAPHSRAAVRSHSAVAGPGWAPAIGIRRGGSRRWSATQTPPSGLWAARARPQDRGAVVDQDMLVDGGGGLPGPGCCPAQASGQLGARLG